jgi:hypothetical protein
MQNLPYAYFSSEPYKMPYFLSIGQITYTSTWNFTNFALFCTQINIKSMLLQNGPHHNLSTRGFDKYVFQIFFSEYLR